jgi:hypothetical protein
MHSHTRAHCSFSVFLSMLQTALHRSSDAVFIDLLTFADLETLKARKQGKAPPPPPVDDGSGVGGGNKKRCE